MLQKTDPKEKLVQKTLESFWQTVPPIWHAARMLTHRIVTEEYGFTPSRFHTLRRIADGKSSVSDLADCMHVSRPNISRTVDDLVKEGFVQRKQDSQDRRNIHLSLTDEGRSMITSLHEKINREMEKKLTKLTRSELDEIQGGLFLLQKIFSQQEINS